MPPRLRFGLVCSDAQDGASRLLRSIHGEAMLLAVHGAVEHF